MSGEGVRCVEGVLGDERGRVVENKTLDKFSSARRNCPQ